MNLVIDTNIFIFGLIKDGLTRHLILNCPHNLFIPEHEIIEVKNHEDEIVVKSKMSKEEVRDLTRRLLRYVSIIRRELLISFKSDAKNIIGDIDFSDVPFIAAALFLKCPVWSDDKHFEKQDQVKVFKTKDILRFMEEESDEKNII
ncbi:MAG: hypothetical protein KKC19_01875 [Nanoarchaeota archaeon]|nr:hypothetical protein [Nanoarchaeota archaeon]